MLNFIESGMFIYVLAVIAGIGITTKLITAVRYSKLELHAEDAGMTQDTYIRLWKNKFENAYRINKGMNDPELFVERCINQFKMIGLPMGRWDRLNRVLCSVCLAISALAVTVEVRSGVETYLVLDHFLTTLSICSLMVFIEVFCETGEKRHRIGLNLTEYFVNTLSHRLKNSVEMVTSEVEDMRRGMRDRGSDVKTEKAGLEEPAKEKRSVLREDEHRDGQREQLLRESLERIAASREPVESRRERRNRAKREEDVRLIEEILREYLD